MVSMRSQRDLSGWLGSMTTAGALLADETVGNRATGNAGLCHRRLRQRLAMKEQALQLRKELGCWDRHCTSDWRRTGGKQPTRERRAHQTATEGTAQDPLCGTHRCRRACQQDRRTCSSTAFPKSTKTHGWRWEDWARLADDGRCAAVHRQTDGPTRCVQDEDRNRRQEGRGPVPCRR
ncbi:hypothetical protein BC831DRAFT_450880, partial [Entophlyctis helioformis]